MVIPRIFLTLFLIFRLNNEQFSPLDVALMLNEHDISSYLLKHGAIENPACK